MKTELPNSLKDTAKKVRGEMKKLSSTDKTIAVLRIKLGEPLSDIAKELGAKTSTVAYWVETYKPPSKDVLLSLVAEMAAKRLLGEPQGSELNALINAVKIVIEHTGDSVDLLSVLSKEVEVPELEL